MFSQILNCFHQVRAVSARALGALVKELGEDNCSDLLPWLMETLISESSSVDRSGAAQGEILHQYSLNTKKEVKCFEPRALMPRVGG